MNPLLKTTFTFAGNALSVATWWFLLNPHPFINIVLAWFILGVTVFSLFISVFLATMTAQVINDNDSSTD